MTDAEVERVARAICIAEGIDPDARVTKTRANYLSGNPSLMFIPSDDYISPAWIFYRCAARAAIDAVLEIKNG